LLGGGLVGAGGVSTDTDIREGAEVFAAGCCAVTPVGG